MSTVTIGFFDGVHLGHQRILSIARERAAAEGHEPTVVTFDRHPREVVDPANAPRLLMAHELRLATVAEAAGGSVHVLEFDQWLRSLSPAEFVDVVIVERLAAKRVVVGENFRFGSRAAGDVDVLTALCAERGIEVEGVPLVRLEGQVVSSSAIREAILRGQLEWASSMLGRPVQVQVEGETPDAVAKGDLISDEQAGWSTTSAEEAPWAISISTGW